jgi:hypothetical protein
VFVIVIVVVIMPVAVVVVMPALRMRMRMRMRVPVPMVVVQHPVEQPGTDPVHDQSRDRHHEHDPRDRLSPPTQLGERLADDLHRRPEQFSRTPDVSSSRFTASM